MKIQPKQPAGVEVKFAFDVLDVVSTPMPGHTASTDMLKALIDNMDNNVTTELAQDRLEGVAEFLHNLADAIDDGVLVA